MPSIDSEGKTGADYMVADQGSAEVTYNQAVNIFSLLGQLVIQDLDLSAPPGGESEGDTYYVAGTGSGAWAWHDGELATFRESLYQFDDVQTGYVAYIVDEGVRKMWDGSAWVFPATVSCPPQTQIYYVGKHGNDANTGLHINSAFLTIDAARAAAAAQTPAADNRFVLHVVDAGIYTEDTSLPQYVSLYAPNATVDGEVDFVDDCYVTLGKHLKDTSGNAAHYTGSTEAHYSCKEMTIENAIGVRAEGGGTVHVRGGLFTLDEDIGIYAVRANINLDIHEINVSDSGAGAIGIRADSDEVIVGRVGRIVKTSGSLTTGLKTTGTAKIDLHVGIINCDTAYDIAAGTTLNLFYEELSGTQTATGTVNLWQPPVKPTKDGEVLVYDSWTGKWVPKHPSKFVQGRFTWAKGGAAASSIGTYPSIIATINAGAYATGMVEMPKDFGSLVKAEIIGFTFSAGAVSGNLNVSLSYCADDEPHKQHTGASTTIPYSVSANQDKFRSDITSLLGSLAANDCLGVDAKPQSGSSWLHMCLILIEYIPNYDATQ